jgi:hypothetical protein
MRRAARAACAGSSATRNRTKTLVSTAVMASLHFHRNGLPHLFHGLRGLPCLKAATDFIERTSWKRLLRLQQDAIFHGLDGELSSRRPFVGVSNGFGQDYLPL